MIQKLSNHNTKNDAWIAVKGVVYDITKYIDIHPGGTIIMEGVGTDATELFSIITRELSFMGQCSNPPQGFDYRNIKKVRAINGIYLFFDFRVNV